RPRLNRSGQARTTGPGPRPLHIDVPRSGRGPAAASRQAHAIHLAEHSAARDAVGEIPRDLLGGPALKPEGFQTTDTVFCPDGGGHGRLPGLTSPIGSPAPTLPFP